MKLKYICLGTGLAKNKNGFSGKGDWNLFKCFYEDKGRYGEFYFNFNIATDDVEILNKDRTYADTLLFGLEKEFGLGKESQIDIQITDKEKLIDWNEFSNVLKKLSENKDKIISRHAKGLIKSLKL